MKCGKCGKELQEGWKNCPYCGAYVENNENGMSKEEKQSDNSKPKKKRSLMRIIDIAAVILIVIVVLISCSDSDDNGQDGHTDVKEQLANIEKALMGDDAAPKPEEYLYQEGSKLPIALENAVRSAPYGYAQISFDLVNREDIDFRTAEFALMVWDANMLPVKVNSSYDENVNEYVITLRTQNIAANSTRTASWDLYDVSLEELAHYNIFLINAEDMDGNIWVNPIAEIGEEDWAGKKLDSSMYAYSFIDDAQ